MLIYVLLFCLLIFFSASEQHFKHSKFPEFRMLLFLILLLFVSARPPGGDKDYVSYLLSFSSFKDPLDYFNNYGDWVYFDPMYYLIPSFFKTYVTQVHYALITFFVYALIALSLKFVAISRLSEFFFLSLVVYFSNYFLLHEMTQIRVGVATAIFLFAIPYLQEKKYLHYFGMVLLALLFHYSSVLYILPLFLKPDHFNKKVYYAALALILVLVVVPTNFLMPLLRLDTGDVSFKSNNYLEYAELGITQQANKLNPGFIMSYLLTILWVLFIDQLQQHNPFARLLVKLQIMALLLFQFFAPIPGFAFRFSEIFLCTQIVTTPFLVYLFKNRWLGYASVIFISIIYLWLNLFYGKLMLDYFK